MTRYLRLNILLSVLAVLIVGCKLNPLAPEVVVDNGLPTVNEIRTMSNMSEVGLEWTPIEDERVQGYYVYRAGGKDTSGKFKQIAKINNRYATHYADKDLVPSMIYRYRMLTYASTGKVSPAGQIVTVETKERFEAVPFIQAISQLPKQIKLIWRPHPNTGVTSYVIEKRKPINDSWSEEKEVEGRLTAEYMDSGLGNNKEYEYRIFAKIGNVKSKPSQSVIARTKPLPHTVQNIKTTTNLPKKITITWDAVPNDDIAYYKVYSSPTSILLFTYLAKTHDTKFEDLINTNGRTRYYKVTAVDKDGLESEKQDAIMGRTLGAPNEPTITKAIHDGSQITVTWGGVNRASTYTLIRKGNSETKKIGGITGTTYVDSNVMPGVEYTYKVVAIDEHGLASDSSDSVDITIE